MIMSIKINAEKFLRDDRGVASIEFVIVFPVIFSIFLMAFESGLMMTKAVMFERAVDIVMEDLLLQKIPSPTHELLREMICKNTVILAKCEADLVINLTPVKTDTWNIKNQKMTCVNRVEDIKPTGVIEVTGEDNELMLMRACLAVDALMPTSGLGLRYEADKEALFLTVTSAFMNEPVEK